MLSELWPDMNTLNRYLAFVEAAFHQDDEKWQDAFCCCCKQSKKHWDSVELSHDHYDSDDEVEDNEDLEDSDPEADVESNPSTSSIGQRTKELAESALQGTKRIVEDMTQMHCSTVRMPCS